MGYGNFAPFTITLASGLTSTSGLDLGGHAWDKVAVEIPTMACAGTMYLQGSSDNSTFRRIYQPDGVSSVVNFQIPQTVSNVIAVLPRGPYRYMKVETTTGTTDTVLTFKFHCS